MLRTFRYRLYPNSAQRIRIRKNIDACRFVYNWALETKKTAYEMDELNFSWYDLNNRLPTLKENHPFLKDAYSQSLNRLSKEFIWLSNVFFDTSNNVRVSLVIPSTSGENPHDNPLRCPSSFKSILRRNESICQKLGQ